MTKKLTPKVQELNRKADEQYKKGNLNLAKYFWDKAKKEQEKQK